MALINLNDTTPGAPSGFQNTKWQADTGSPRNVSAYIPGTGGVVVKTADYTAVAADCGKLIVFNSSGAHALTLPAAAPFAQWNIGVQNIGTGIVTISPNGLNIDGSASSLTVPTNQGVYISTDGANYFSERGISSFTNPMTTKGDVIVGAASGVPARLPVGANGQVLTANSSATDGLDWETQPIPVGGMTIDVNGSVVASGLLTVDVNGSAVASGLTIIDVNGSAVALGVVGTVISIGLTMPTEFSVAGSPITSSGTLAVTKANQSANLVYAGPSSGSPAAPTFRSLAAGDLPLATTGAFGAVKPDGSTITISSGVISSAGLTNPMTTKGDVIYGGTSGTPTRLAAGTTGQILQTNGSSNVPTWVAQGLTLISSNILGTASSSVTFSSIPGTFNNLRLVVGGRHSNTSQDYIVIQFNGDASANYDYEGFYFGGVGNSGTTNLGAFQGTSTASPQIAYLNGSNGPGSTPGLADIFIPQYAGTTFYKTATSDGTNHGTTAYTGIQGVKLVTSWHNAAAITSILLKMGGGGNFITGSWFYLYGY